METIGTRYVKMEHMNHHDSMYAGTAADWLCEFAFMGLAKAIGRQDGFVMSRIMEIQFVKPILLGTLLDFRYEVAHYGRTSFEGELEAGDLLFEERIFLKARFLFVNIDEQGDKCPHGLAGSRN